jgi:hypothetical protein
LAKERGLDVEASQAEGGRISEMSAPVKQSFESSKAFRIE